jgi:hypothetical protein
MIAQSIAWAYAPEPRPHREDHPLDLNAEGDRLVSVRGVEALEGQVLGASPMVEGLVLRFGRLYGPGSGTDTPPSPPAVHVDAAAYAALLAIDHGEAGAFNAADPNDEVSTEKARAALGWRADFRMDAGLGRRYSTRSSRLFPAAAGHNRRHRDGPFGFPWILSSRDLSVDYTGKTAEIFFPRLLPEVSRAGGASTVLAWGSAGSLMTLA